MRLAMDRDLLEVLRWLKGDDEEHGDGFWCNANIIEDAQRDGDLYVLPDPATDLPIALLAVDKFRPNIVSVKMDRRGEGHGIEVGRFMIDLWRQRGADVIEIECSPEDSAEFWQKLGFKVYGQTEGPYPTPRAYMLLTRTLPEPGGRRADVVIRWFPEEAAYGGAVEPFQTHRPAAVWADALTVQLNERVFLFSDLYRQRGRGDIVVQIEVDGVQQVFAKAKYEEAASVGVEEADFGWAIEQIVVAA